MNHKEESNNTIGVKKVLKIGLLLIAMISGLFGLLYLLFIQIDFVGNKTISNTEIGSNIDTINSQQAPIRHQNSASFCVFDLATQTDDFIKNVPEFSNYTWDKDSHTATITLKDNKTILAQRGGCNHFGISAEWNEQLEVYPITDVKYWLQQSLWISQKIMPEVDYLELQEMIQKEEYELSEDSNGLYISFTSHSYSDWATKVNWLSQKDKTVVFTTGYYFD